MTRKRGRDPVENLVYAVVRRQVTLKSLERASDSLALLVRERSSDASHLLSVTARSYVQKS